MSTQKFKIGEKVYLPYFNDVGIVDEIDRNDQPIKVKLKDKVLKNTDYIIEKLSILLRLVIFVRSLFK